MVSYRVLLARSAERELRRVPGPDLPRLVRRIAALGGEPRPGGCMKLSGVEGWRIRQGDWRVVYQIDDAAREVRVVKVGHRREVYR